MPNDFSKSALALPGIVGTSPAMHAVAERVHQVANARSSVLIIGETGTGKELIARAIHQLGSRVDGPYVRVNCGALSDGLLESELFGHVKGAFTGAIDHKTGRFESAHTGTIFLDEISSMSPKLQVKLLRVLQEHEFERVGESKTIRVDVRVIAATNQFLEEEVDANRFRDDLYYRLNVVPIYLPPLRDRREDIPLLIDHFIQQYSSENSKMIESIDSQALEWLTHHPWLGNVRELENAIERAIVLSTSPRLVLDSFILHPQAGERRLNQGRPTHYDLPSAISQLVRLGLHDVKADEGAKLYDHLVISLEKELIQQVLEECNGVQTRAASRLGINRNTLFKKMQEFGISDEGK
jgi:transcriptional regulator with GAF, ATPase, and Fis domain